MTAAARKAARRRASPATESAVYDGRVLCGTITSKAGACVARLPSGKQIGRFAKENEAQRALTAASRAARESEAQIEGPNGFAWKPGEVVVGQPGAGARSKGRAQARAPLADNQGIQQ